LIGDPAVSPESEEISKYFEPFCPRPRVVHYRNTSQDAACPKYVRNKIKIKQLINKELRN